jgi:hypothetical protein
MSHGNAAQVYLLNAVMPMIRRIYPSMVSSKSISNLNVPLADIEIQKLRGCQFLSNRRLKKGIKDFHPKGLVNIIKVYNENGTFYKDIHTYSCPSEIEDLIVELATLADLHGIIKLSGHSIWMKQIEDVKNLNVDDRLIDRLSRSLTGKGFAP